MAFDALELAVLVGPIAAGVGVALRLDELHRDFGAGEAARSSGHENGGKYGG